jgi:beta-galactosidase
VPHAGADSARFREVVALGDALARLAPVAGSPVEAEVALLFDWEAWWACDRPSMPSGELRYLDAAHRWHAAFTGLGAGVDVVHPSADLDRYAVVVVPTLYLCSDADADGIAAAARRGAQVVVTYFSGIADERDHVRLGGYPGAFRELLGVRAEEFAPLPPGVTVTLDDGATADLWTEVLAAPDAEVVASFVDGPVAGAPALTRRGVDAGAAWYVATRLDVAATAALAARVAAAAGMPATALPPGVTLTRRGRHAFVLNRGDRPAPVDVRGTDLLTGAPFPGVVAGRSAAVVEEV